MTKDEEEVVARDFMGLGSGTIRSREGHRGADRGSPLGAMLSGEESNRDQTSLNSSLSNSSAQKRLGGFLGNGGFSLNPVSTAGCGGNFGREGASSFDENNPAAGSERLTMGRGGAFNEFNRPSASKRKFQYGVSRLAGEEIQPKDEGVGALSSTTERGGAIVAGKPLEELADADIQQLTREEIWRLILELGMRWPSWNKSVSLHTQQGPARERGSTLDSLERGSLKVKEEGSPRGNVESLQGQYYGNNSSRTLTSRALEELARTPERSSIPAAGLPLFLLITQEDTESTSLANSTSLTVMTAGAPALSQQAAGPAATPPAFTQPRHLGSNSQGEPQTAQLTIFYAGTVNVYDNVPEDKAHFIMLLAGSRGHSWSSSMARHISSQNVGSMAAPAMTTTPVKPWPQVPPTPAAVSTSSPLVSGPRQQQQQQPGTSTQLSMHERTQSGRPCVLPLLHVPSPQGQKVGSSFAQLPQLQPQRPESLSSTVTSSRVGLVPPRPIRELPQARKSSLARFLDMRQKRARVNLKGSDGVTSNEVPDGSSEPSQNASSDSKTMDAPFERSKSPMSKCSRPSSPSDTRPSMEIQEGYAAAEKSSGNLREGDGRTKLAIENEALPMEVDSGMPLSGT